MYGTNLDTAHTILISKFFGGSTLIEIEPPVAFFQYITCDQGLKFL